MAQNQSNLGLPRHSVENFSIDSFPFRNSVKEDLNTTRRLNNSENVRTFVGVRG